MAKIHPPFPLSGQWAGLSVYSMRGAKDQVARQPYGPSAKDIATKDCYNITRRNNSEHSGCSKASKWLRRNFHPLEPIRGYPMSGPVTGWLKPYLTLDTESAFGRRHICLSKQPRLLEGINLSERYPFDAVVRGGIAHHLNRETLSAHIELPALLPGTSFSPSHHPYFRVAATLGLAPDVFWSPQGYSFDREYEQCFPQVAQSVWLATKAGSEALTLELQLPYPPPNAHFALVLTLGIMMGTAGKSGELEPVKYAGCAKVLAAV
jgi:hypothetical protein